MRRGKNANTPFRRFPLIPRRKHTDKTVYGHVLVLSGSRGMTGAPQLVARACLASGAGLVTVALPKSARGAFAKKALAEVMTMELPEGRGGVASAQAIGPMIRFIKERKIACLAVGPGLTRGAAVGSLVRRLVMASSVPVVLDADGLNAFDGHLPLLKKHPSPVVLTPHEGEFKRLFRVKPPLGAKPRAALAKKLSRFYDVSIVLKGHRTLVADNNRCYVNHTGNPGMAKGGSGDVLTGILAAFIAQGLPPYQAACWAVHFHGRAGDNAVKIKGELGLLAGDIIDALPRAFRLE